MPGGLPQQVAEAPHDGSARIRTLDGTQLGGSDGQDTGHGPALGK